MKSERNGCKDGCIADKENMRWEAVTEGHQGGKCRGQADGILKFHIQRQFGKQSELGPERAGNLD
jgi:hypothetical protein